MGPERGRAGKFHRFSVELEGALNARGVPAEVKWNQQRGKLVIKLGS